MQATACTATTARWKVWFATHRQVTQLLRTGAKQLQAAIAQQDAEQLASLRDELLLLQEGGTPFAEDSWPAHLLRTEKRYLDVLDDWRVRAREFYGGTPRGALVPKYVPSKELDRLVVPKERYVASFTFNGDTVRCAGWCTRWRTTRWRASRASLGRPSCWSWLRGRGDGCWGRAFPVKTFDCKHCVCRICSVATWYHFRRSYITVQQTGITHDDEQEVAWQATRGQPNKLAILRLSVRVVNVIIQMCSTIVPQQHRRGDGHAEQRAHSRPQRCRWCAGTIRNTHAHPPQTTRAD